MMERIAKRLAHAGLCSRRDAERLIADGKVSVNGQVLTSPAVNVSDSDVILVNGQRVEDRPPTKLWRYHKPVDELTTARDPEGRATVFDGLPEELGRVISVGRLDLNSEGLLLLTNNGELARYFELPATGWLRRYRVRVFGHVTEEKISEMEKGLVVEGVHYGPMEIKVEKGEGRNSWLEVGLKEGKNREIRKVMAAMELTVNRLIRISYGPFSLGTLPRGAIAEVPQHTLREQLPVALLSGLPELDTATGKPQGWAKAKPKKNKVVHKKPLGQKPPVKKKRKNKAGERLAPDGRRLPQPDSVRTKKRVGKQRLMQAARGKLKAEKAEAKAQAAEE